MQVADELQQGFNGAGDLDHRKVKGTEPWRLLPKSFNGAGDLDHREEPIKIYKTCKEMASMGPVIWITGRHNLHWVRGPFLHRFNGAGDLDHRKGNPRTLHWDHHWFGFNGAGDLDHRKVLAFQVVNFTGVTRWFSRGARKSGKWKLWFTGADSNRLSNNELWLRGVTGFFPALECSKGVLIRKNLCVTFIVVILRNRKRVVCT